MVSNNFSSKNNYSCKIMNVKIHIWIIAVGLHCSAYEAY